MFWFFLTSFVLIDVLVPGNADSFDGFFYQLYGPSSQRHGNILIWTIRECPQTEFWIMTWIYRICYCSFFFEYSDCWLIRLARHQHLKKDSNFIVFWKWEIFCGNNSWMKYKITLSSLNQWMCKIDLSEKFFYYSINFPNKTAESWIPILRVDTTKIEMNNYENSR